MVGHVHVRVHVREPLPSPPRGSRRARRIRPCRRLEPRPCRLRTSAGRRALEVPARGTEGHGEGGGGAAVTCSPWVPLLQWRGLPHSSTAPRIDQKEGGGTTVPLFRAYDNVSVSYLSMGSPGIRPIRLYRFTEDNVSTSFWNVFQIRILYIYISLEDIEEILFNYSNNFVYNFEYEEKNRITSYEESEKKREGRDSLYRSRSSE